MRALTNLPLGDKIAFRLSGFYDDVAGYIDDPSLGRTELNQGKKYGGRASVLFAPTDALSIRLTAASQKSTYDGTNMVDIDPDTLSQLSVT